MTGPVPGQSPAGAAVLPPHSEERRPLLRVRDLTIGFGSPGRRIPVVRDAGFDVRDGEVVALVGESGSGKSTTGLALLGLLPKPAASVEGRIELIRRSGAAEDVARMSERQLRDLRGNDVAIIFQEPMSSLNPIYKIGTQIGEALQVHSRLTRRERDDEALRLVTILGIPSPAKCLASYPHQLSGGMRQRVMIAMALAGRPRLLVADEPTTALDVTIQAQIVEHLRQLQRETGMAMLFVTHDLGLVTQIADRVLVMYAGEIVEEGPAAEIFRAPRMPYTRALMRSRPKLGSLERVAAIPGVVPSPAALPPGCSFAPRCAHVRPGRCDAGRPVLEEAGPGRKVRCVRWREIAEWQG